MWETASISGEGKQQIFGIYAAVVYGKERFGHFYAQKPQTTAAEESRFSVLHISHHLNDHIGFLLFLRAHILF